MQKNYDVPNDPTRNGSFLIWTDTYDELANIINSLNIKNFLEIGVAGGQNILNLSRKTSIRNFYGVDSYDPLSWDMSREMIYENFKSFDNLHHEVKNFLDKLTYGRTTLIRKKSVEAASDFKNHSLDCVFIDADHSFKSVLKDIIFWLPKVKPSGYLMGHDYNHSGHKGTTRAVNLTLGRVLTGNEKSYIWYINVNKIHPIRLILIRIFSSFVRFF